MNNTLEVSELHDALILDNLGETWGENYKGWFHFEKDGEEGLCFRVPDTFLFEDKLSEAKEEHKFLNAIRFPVFKWKVTVLFDFKNVEVIGWEKGSLDFSLHSEDLKDMVSKRFPPYLKLLNKFSKGLMPPQDLERQLKGIVSFMNWSDSIDLPNVPTIGYSEDGQS